MLSHRRYPRSFLVQAAFWRVAVFVVVLVIFVKNGTPAPSAEPSPLPPNTVDAFKQFLASDMDRLGKLVDLKLKTEAKIDMKDEHKEQNDYYQKVVNSLDAQINSEMKTAKERAAALENQLSSAAVTASVMRLRTWEAPDTRGGLQQLDKGELYARVSAKFAADVADLAANGTPEDQAALCVMLGEDAAYARTLKGEGRSYLIALQKQIPQVVKLAQRDGRADRIVREKAAVALAQLHAQAKDQIAAVNTLLDKDGGDVATRRVAYKVLVLPFDAASPRTLAASPNATQYSLTDQAEYAKETRQLLDDQAGLALPYLVKGLKDDDLAVRQLSIKALRDIAAILLVPLQPAPRLGKDVVDYDFRLKDPVTGKGMIADLKRIQPLVDKLADNAPALVDAAADPDPTIRLQALAMLNDLAESRNRIRGWRAQIDPAPPPPPEKPIAPADAKEKPDALPAVLDAQPAKPDDPSALGGKLTTAFKPALKVLAKNLSDPDPTIRLAALDVLENVGADANSPDTIPALVKALGDPNKFVRWNTLRIFNRFGPIEPQKVIPALIAQVRDQDGDGDFAKTLGPTLSAYGPDAAAAVPAFIKAIQVGEPEARIAYLQTLTYVGVEAADAIPAITEMLKNQDAHVRQAAAEALGRFGKLAAKSAPELRATLDDENPDVRKAVGEALLRISGK